MLVVKATWILIAVSDAVTVSPCTWAICQWGMFTFLLFRGGKGKITTSPPAKTPSAFVCIIWEKVQRTEWIEMRTLITFGCKILRVTVSDYLVDSDEALGVHVDAALFQEARCRNTSCRRGDTFLDFKLFKGEFHYLMCHCRWWRKVKQFFITCSDDTHVRPQDFPALQHHLFELQDRKNKMSRPSHRDARLYTWTASYSFCETMTSL